MIDKHIKFLSQKDLQARRENLCKVLKDEGVKLSQQEYDGGINFTFGRGSEYLFTAHYDNYRNSFGANDNMAAVCILIELAKKIPASFALLDGEEDGHTGAKFFAENCGIKNFSGVVNLDLCGYGDNIVVNAKGKNLERFTAREVLSRHNAQTVKFLPENDGSIFRKYRVPVLSVSIVPKWDVQYLKALASFGERLLGQPPEFDLILSQMEITQTIHNGEKDSPEFVQADAMQKVYDYLYDAMTREYQPRNFFRRLFS